MFVSPKGGHFKFGSRRYLTRGLSREGAVTFVAVEVFERDDPKWAPPKPTIHVPCAPGKRYWNDEKLARAVNEALANNAGDNP
jgi:hypothetical protein